MLLSLNELRDVDVQAVDGSIGRVEECLFDDERWTIRYIVVEAFDIAGRRVLISPVAVRRLAIDRHGLHVSLTSDQIRHSPRIEEHRPVSRQYERTYGNYYGYPPYWVGPGYWGAGSHPGALLREPQPPADQAAQKPAVREEESHLRSSLEVTGYHIQATDGSIGHVDDFLVDETTWVIEFLRLDTSNFIGGKAVLVPRQALRDVRWPDHTIDVALTADEVRTSPEYDPELLRTEGWPRPDRPDEHAR
jgi:hypothetical protein